MVKRETKIFVNPVGLINSGNNCFFNSTMQCILSVHKLTTYYKETEFTDNKPISKAFQKFINDYSSNSQAQNPDQFISVLRKKMNIFNGKQQDAHEFLIQFLEILYNEISKNKITYSTEKEFIADKKLNIITDLFYIYHNQILKCKSCHKTSENPVTNNMVLIEPHSTVSEGLDKHYMDSEVSKDSGWKCENCNISSEASMKLVVKQAPTVLIVHISRFTSTKWKNNNSVEINNTITFCERKYHLIGVVCHSGTLDGGHYFSEAKRQGTWTHYNDRWIKNEKNNYHGSNPYMAFYSSD